MRTRRHSGFNTSLTIGIMLPMAASFTLSALTLGVPMARALAPIATTSAYRALPTPQRLVDTRDTTALEAGDVLTVAVTGAAPLPAPGSIIAAVLNVTVVGPAAVGFWTVYPHGAALPNASNLNVDEVASYFGPALALANMVTVAVYPSGNVDVYTSAGGNVIVDMLGYYESAATATAGRFVPLTKPARMLDTRDSSSPLAAGQTRTQSVSGAAGAAAAVLNVTTIGSNPGYWQVFAAGSSPPVTSNLNTMFAGQIIASQVIVPLDATGRFSVYSDAGGHLIIDVVGTFTGASAPSSTNGLFVPLATPRRFFDTRVQGLNPLGGTQRLLPGWNLEVAVATNPAIARADVTAVAFNLTVTDTFDKGYVSVTPAGSNNPALKSRATSSMNVEWVAQTLVNHVTVPVSARGFDVFAQNPTHALGDVSGFYIGSPSATPFGTPQNVDPTPVFCAGFSPSAIAGGLRGSVSPAVAVIQQRLLDLGFWTSGADGSFGWSTQQAVMAYQKWNHLAPTGSVDALTAHTLNWPNCRPTPGITNGGDLFEVDKGRQLGFFVRNGTTLFVLNISSGGGYFYEEENQLTGEKVAGTAITPNGTFHVYRVYDQAVYEGTLGTLYRPRFVFGGIAVHGAPNVPGYPASHGCIRVSNPAMDMIWALNLLPMGGKVVIHE